MRILPKKNLFSHAGIIVDGEVLETVGPGIVLIRLHVHHIASPAHVGVGVGEIEPVAGHYQVAASPPRLKKTYFVFILFKLKQPTLKRATHLRVFLAIWTVMF